MLITKLYRAWKNFTNLGDNPLNLTNRQCNFCKQMTAMPIANSIPNQSTYYCSYCRHTYSVVDGGDTVGRRKKNKRKQQSKGSTVTHKAAAQNQKVIDKSVVASTTDDSWEVKIDCVEACSKAPDSINIWFLPLAKRKIDALMKEYKNIEWLAYLLGPKGTRDVEDIFIPDQSISTARVDDVECAEFNELSVIGVVHSHHSMGHTFSGTDHDYINGNHDISIVVSHTGLAGQYRFKTPCGSYKIITASVRLKVNLDFNDEEFIESVKPKLQKKTYTTYGNYGAYNNDGFYGGWENQNNRSWRNNEPPAMVATPEEKTDFQTGDFLTDDELEDLRLQVEELDFSKELSLAQELELLEEVDNLDDKETN